MARQQAVGASVVRFGSFALNVHTGELCKGASRLKVPDQSIEILKALLERPGELVSREELRRRLWTSDTHVDFEHGLNAAVRRLRDALSDSAERPRFIETLPRKGYRFVGVIEAQPDFGERTPPPKSGESRRTIPPLRYILAAVTLTAIVAIPGARTYLSLRRSSSSPASWHIQSLGVLPLSNVSGDPRQAFFVEGVQQALVTELSRVHAIRVVVRTLTADYQRGKQSPREICRALRVDGLIQGSVQREASRVRISVGVTDASDGRRVWENSYDRALEDVLTLEADIARAIVEQIHATPTAAELAELNRSRRVKPNAYLEYLQGSYDFARQRQTAYPQAQAHFEKALDFDPLYAPAHAALAMVYAAFGGWNSSYAPGMVRAAAAAEAQRAVDLDPLLPEGYIALGRVKAWFDWDWTGAETAFRRGIDLGPNSSMGRLASGNYLTMTGQFDEAIKMATETADMYPLFASAHQELGLAHEFAGHPAAGLAQFERALELDPTMPAAHFHRALLNIRRGRLQDAIADIDALRTLLGKEAAPHRLGQLGYLYGKVGRSADALALIDELRRRAATEYIPAAAIGNIYLGLNDYERAISEFERALGQHDAWLIWLKANVVYDEIRGLPRFQALVKRVASQSEHPPAVLRR